MSYALLQTAMEKVKAMPGAKDLPWEEYNQLIEAELDKFLNSEWAVGYRDRGHGHGDYAIIVKYTNHVICEAMDGFAKHIVELHNKHLGFEPKPMTKFTCYFKPITGEYSHGLEPNRDWHPMSVYDVVAIRCDNADLEDLFVMPWSDGESDLTCEQLWNIFSQLEDGKSVPGYRFDPIEKIVHIDKTAEVVEQIHERLDILYRK